MVKAAENKNRRPERGLDDGLQRAISRRKRVYPDDLSGFLTCLRLLSKLNMMISGLALLLETKIARVCGRFGCFVVVKNAKSPHLEWGVMLLRLLADELHGFEIQLCSANRAER